MDRVLSADCFVPGWCSFRIPHSINVHLTYPAPPPMTIYGLIANSLGMPQDDYSLRSKLKIGVRILKQGETVETYTQWMKWNPAKDSMTMLVTRQKMIQPHYRFYISSDKESLTAIQQALGNPARILYLGESDDMVEIKNIRLQEAKEAESTTIHSAVPFEAVSDCISPSINVSVLNWPVSFDHQGRNSYSVQYELVYVGKQIDLISPIRCLKLVETQDHILLES
ncbi:CRISPR-associated protein Cas5 [Paenactinomyces guangxiensis]|uniref:CRISPR-associated protein Cas5 n=1 Tax=Paenactinomyces guangxiensis TaxID=1490290 RepID=A0A7W1WNQ9_9BACL|nr:CRISPR-associated protein Cas5 [Paenactinomyces guangxiensis]MBA4493252.1 CRISPR-associated protein Cas5 [Paenactinomyces guangxiensis]MBH8589897.1 CRISPR-associated protein Cas5 [Paenactinomyces guangxiensis]